MIYIHPPLAFIGYLFFYAFTVFLFMKRDGKLVKRLGYSAWAFTFLGLVTGMYWAQIAWGSFWSWDPKETLTLVMFGFVTASVISFLEGKNGLAKLFSLISCVTIIITLLSSFLIQGLHSFLAWRGCQGSCKTCIHIFCGCACKLRTYSFKFWTKSILSVNQLRLQ